MEATTLYQDVPESVGSISGSNGQENLEQSAILKESHSHNLCLLKECEKGYWILPQFGTISKHLTADHGVDQWTALLQESHVSHIVWPEKDVVRKMIEIFGQICGESLGKWNPGSCWWKTSQVSLLDGKPTDFESWENSNQWVLSYAASLYRLERSELGIGEIVDLSLVLGVKKSHSIPTPTASDWIDRKSNSKERQNFLTNKSVSLKDYVKMFPTPTSDAAMRKKRYAQEGMPLSLAAQTFPTPNAIDPIKYGIKGDSQRCKNLVAMGKRGELGQKVGKLNPQWIEWLMGFPSGWTELKDLETQSFLKFHKKWLKEYYKSLSKKSEHSLEE